MKDPQSSQAPRLERRRIPVPARPVKAGSPPAKLPAKKRLSALAFLAVINLLLIAACASVIILICSRAHSFIKTEPDPGQDIPQSEASAVTTVPEQEPGSDEPSVPAVTMPEQIYAEYTENTKILTNEIASEYAILIDLSDFTVLASKRSSDKIYPASMTKVMTLVAAAENIDLGKTEADTFMMTADIINPLVLAGASRAGFVAGENVPIKDLLYGAILPSGADATMGLALYTSGSDEAFTDLMNAAAQKIGLKNTRFENNTGLHSANHYSTVHDMALIMKYAMQNELCAQALSAKKYTTSSTQKKPEGLTLYSTTFSRMTKYIQKSNDVLQGVTIIAGKTGFTNEALNCLVTYAVLDSDPARAYICCTAYANNDLDTIQDCFYMYSNFIPAPETGNLPD